MEEDNEDLLDTENLFESAYSSQKPYSAA